MSALSQHLEEYLRLRRLLGHQLADAGRLLPRFVAYLDANNIEFVTVEAAVAWALAPDVPAGTTVSGRRMMAVRGFTRYLAGIDPRTEVPPAGLIPLRRRWRPPFIYGDADIAALMDEARRAIRQPLRAATYETLIGLLAATGPDRPVRYTEIRALPGRGAEAAHRPRIHDLRHTFAVRTLLGWYRDGVDVQARLPLLATYLGHREPRYTYHYLSAAPELLGHAARLLEHTQAVRP
jgi:integrase